jgi:tetratricopeptide (TPR) repeat protein
MKNRKNRRGDTPLAGGSKSIQPPRAAVAVAVEDRPDERRWKWWYIAGAILFAAFVAFEVYGPALRGEFLFDDSYLPFLRPEMQNAPLHGWLGVRPFLMFSFWLNYRSSGVDPYPYHAFNVVLHTFNAVLAALIVRKLLVVAGEKSIFREILSVFAGALFLLHPAQTEAVAYVASRSEAMSVLFFFAAYAVFLYRRNPSIGFGRTILILILFAMAASSKEHTTVLPALLLLTDFWFNTPFRLEGIRRNLKLYAPIAILGALGLAAVWRVLSTAQTAGFAVSEFKWYEYLFTQYRVIWTYIRLFILPINLNGDYDYPVSRSILDGGSILGLLGLVALAVLAWKYRRRYPLASFGYFGFLLLLAPTSSFVPIRDVIAERRLYLPFICLTLIAIDFLRRWRVSPVALGAALTVVCCLGAAMAYNRNKVWSNPLAFWQDTAAKSPNNGRARFQLAFAQWQSGNCAAAVKNYAAVEKMQAPDDRLYIDWAHALDCLNQPDEAVAKLREAIKIKPSALAYAQVGMIYGKRGHSEEALAALNEAEKIDPGFEMTYVYKGNLDAARGDHAAASAQYTRALAINPHNETAKQALAISQQQLRPR